jgi:hypothetical protein
LQTEKANFMRKIFALAAVLVVFASSCSKKDATATSSNIQARWDVDKVVETYVFAGQTDSDEWSYPGDYFEFKSGGTFLGQLDSEPLVGTWELVDGGAKVRITDPSVNESKDFTVKSINGSNLVLSIREGTSSDYFESTIYLSK